MFKQMHLRTRMTVSIISVVILIFVLMTLFNYSKSSALIETEAYNKTQYMSEVYAQDIETSLERSFVGIRKIRDTIISLKTHNLTSTREPIIDMIRTNAISDKALTLAAENINHSGDDLLENSKKLMSVSEKLSSSSTEQSSALVETATAMDEINAMVQTNTQAAKKGKIASEHSNKSALEGKEATDHMISSIKMIREATSKLTQQTNRSNQEVQEIIDIFNTITDKTQVINDIVFQTKLLSFNASVEAARAGEQGKGFAVVAEEVGKLAEMSGKSSQEISQLLSESTVKIENIISKNKQETESLLQETEQKVTSGIQTAENCAEALDKILTNSAEVSSLVDEIFSASEQQAAGVAEVSKAIAELEVAAQANSNLASEAAQASQSINLKSDELKVVAENLSKVIVGDKSA